MCDILNVMPPRLFVNVKKKKVGRSKVYTNTMILPEVCFHRRKF